MWKNEVVLRLVIAVITAVVTSLLTHIFDSKKLRKQQDIAFQESLGKVIIRAYIKTREIVLQLETVEALSESIQFSRKNQEKSAELPYHAAIMEDIQTLSEYGTKVSDARKEFDAYLSNKAAAFLLILEHYFVELASFIGNHELQDKTKYIGRLVYPDLHKIEIDFDIVIVNEINRPRYYLESKCTTQYEYLIEDFKKKYIDNSVLMGMIDKGIDIQNVCSENDGNAGI